MAGIALNAADEWMVSRWICRRLLGSASEVVILDSELHYWLQVGIANDMLDLGLIDSIAVRDLVSVLRASAEQQIADESAVADLPADDQDIYVRALRKLLDLLDAKKTMLA